MPLAPTWSLDVAHAMRYFMLRGFQPRLALNTASEPLHARVTRLHAAWSRSRLSDADRLVEFNQSIFEAAFHKSRRRVPSVPVIDTLLELGLELALQNDIVIDFPDVDLNRSLTAAEATHLSERLTELQTRLEHDDRIHGIFSENLSLLLRGMLNALPDAAFSKDPAPFSVPLHALLDPIEVVSSFIVTFLQHFAPDGPDAIAAIPFAATRDRLFQNLLAVSELSLDQYEKGVPPHRRSGDCGLPPEQMIQAYLGGTPLVAFAEMPMPFRIPDSVRNEHILMVARTGSGKTQFIQRDILDNLMRPDGPGMVVIDSQNQMIPKLEKLQAAKDRIVIVDPFDVAPPALNMFLSPRPPIADPNLREAIEANTLQQFAWIFSALDQELTGRQTTLFTFTTRILMAMQADMQAMLDFMRIEKTKELKASKFWPTIEAADEQTRYFFEHRFCTADYNKTKDGVADRLLGVLRVQAFNRMFMAPANNLDLYALLAERKLVVFNTHKRSLGNDASAILGRYAIALYIRAAFERELDKDPPPAFLYVDEASEYFGKKDSTDTLFTQLRKYNCGSFVAFQDLSQLGLQHHILISQTTTKLTGGLAVADAGKLAAEMRTSERELMAIGKRDNAFDMMCYVGNVTPGAVKLTFGYGAVEDAPQLSVAEHAALRERNRRLLSARTVMAQPPRHVPVAPVRASEPAFAPDAPAPPAKEIRDVPNSEIKPGKDWSLR